MAARTLAPLQIWSPYSYQLSFLDVEPLKASGLTIKLHHRIAAPQLPAGDKKSGQSALKEHCHHVLKISTGTVPRFGRCTQDAGGGSRRAAAGKSAAPGSPAGH